MAETSERDPTYYGYAGWGSSFDTEDVHHTEHHFDPSGLCQCVCSECTTPARFCTCKDCRCEESSDHAAWVWSEVPRG